MKRKAIALHYNPSMNLAPKVLASGEGKIASMICQIAEENRILFITDEALVESLVKLPVGSEIPKELYDCVAIIFRFLLSSSH